MEKLQNEEVFRKAGEDNKFSKTIKKKKSSIVLIHIKAQRPNQKSKRRKDKREKL